MAKAAFNIPTTLSIILVDGSNNPTLEEAVASSSIAEVENLSSVMITVASVVVYQLIYAQSWLI